MNTDIDVITYILVSKLLKLLNTLYLKSEASPKSFLMDV